MKCYRVSIEFQVFLYETNCRQCKYTVNKSEHGEEIYFINW